MFLSSRFVFVQVGRNGQLPKKFYVGDAGFDLFSSETKLIPRSKTALVDLDIKIELPPGTFGKIETRSSQGKRGIISTCGVIDQGYRGPLSVVLHNLGEDTYVIEKGDRVAQLIIHPFYDFYTIQKRDKINTQTERGVGGFGSSGK